jgi:hypothetical protein
MLAFIALYWAACIAILEIATGLAWPVLVILGIGPPAAVAAVAVVDRWREPR